MKTIFIEPANSTGIFRKYPNNSKNVRNQLRRYGEKVWFTNKCELLCKE